MSADSSPSLPPLVPGTGRGHHERVPKGMTGGIRSGMALPLRSLRFLLSRRGVKRFAVMPLLATLIVYAGVVFLALWLYARWDWGLSGDPWQFWGGFGGWLFGVLDGSIDVVKWMVGLPVLIGICYFSFTSVGMIVGGPFNDLLSERVERSICGQQDRPESSKAAMMRSMLLTTWDAVKLVGVQIFCIILVLPFLLVPVIGFLPLLLVTAYFSGVGFVDIAMTRNGFRNDLKKPVLRARRWQILGLGLGMELLFLIPFVGLMILPLGVVAGTMFYCFYDWESYFQRLGREPPKEFVYPRPDALRLS